MCKSHFREHESYNIPTFLFPIFFIFRLCLYRPKILLEHLTIRNIHIVPLISINSKSKHYMLGPIYERANIQKSRDTAVNTKRNIFPVVVFDDQKEKKNVYLLFVFGVVQGLLSTSANCKCFKDDSYSWVTLNINPKRRWTSFALWNPGDTYKSCWNDLTALKKKITTENNDHRFYLEFYFSLR